MITYNYGRASLERLATAHPDFDVIFKEVIKWVNCSIFCGHRNEADQNAAYPKFSKVKWPDSRHNSLPSMAVDAGPYFIELRNTDWNDRLAFAQFSGRVLQIADQLLYEGKVSHRLISGQDWDRDGRSLDHKFVDVPHYQLEKVSEEELEEIRQRLS